VLREVAERTGTRIEPGGALRHVAVMAWDPDAEGNDPGVLTRRAEIGYGARLVLYPAPGGDHTALGRLLADLADDRFGPTVDLPAGTASPPDAHAGGADRGGMAVRWVPPTEGVEHFTGRAEELARLDRWAADPQVALVGVTAWGGAGKTALVTHWVQAGGVSRRAGPRRPAMVGRRSSRPAAGRRGRWDLDLLEPGVTVVIGVQPGDRHHRRHHDTGSQRPGRCSRRARIASMAGSSLRR
jgi:hypothetical protein